MKGKSKRTTQHEMDSGFVHLSDAQAGGVHGTYIDRFGPPGDAKVNDGPRHDGGIVGGAGKLQTRFMRGKAKR